MKLIETFNSDSTADTVVIAGHFSRIFKPGDIILLRGDLGSGKTFIVQAICKEWQVEDDVTSPTFTLIRQYRGRIPVNHIDLYRIGHLRELDNLGWEDLLGDDSVTFVEWPELMEPMLDAYYMIRIEFEGRRRLISLYRSGDEIKT